jgi:hypothetical protein
MRLSHRSWRAQARAEGHVEAAACRTAPPAAIDYKGADNNTLAAE